jgi:hypothetical protein
MFDLARSIILHGGLTMVGIGAVSIASLAVAIERVWRLAPLRRRYRATRAAFLDALLRGGLRAPSAAGLDRDDGMARVLRAGLDGTWAPRASPPAPDRPPNAKSSPSNGDWGGCSWRPRSHRGWACWAPCWASWWSSSTPDR